MKSWLGFEKKSSLAAPEQWLTDLLGGTPAASGIAVTPEVALQCPPVQRAVRLISEAVAQLPCHVYARDEDGSKQRDTDHPASRLLTGAVNPSMSASRLRELVTRDSLIRHGGFAEIVRVGDGKPYEIYYLDPRRLPVTVEYDGWEPVYSVPAHGGQKRVIPRENIIHIPSPALSERGLVHEGRETIGLALIMERYAARLFGNGARPSGVLSVGSTATADTLSKIKAIWQASHGGDKSGGTAVLPADAEWSPITLNSVDAQFLEMRTFAINEVARLFGVPPHMLFEMGRATYSNAETMGQDFLTFTLMPHLVRWQSEIQLKLFSEEDRESYFAEFLTDAITKADIAKRYQAYTSAIASRIFNPNEIRAMENRAPYEGGDIYANPHVTTTTTTTGPTPAAGDAK